MMRKGAILLGLIGLAGMAMARPLAANDAFTAAFNWNVPYSGWAGFYVAQANGYFKDEKLDVKFLLVKGSNPVNQAVGAGSAQVGISNASSVMVAVSKGVPIIATSAYMQTNPEGVITRADRGIKELKDFLGRKVAINVANPTQFLFEAKLRRAKLDPGKINFVSVQPEAAVPLLLSGEVDAILGFWDWQAINVRKQGVEPNVFVMSDDQVQIYGTIVSANRGWIAGNGDAMRRFLKASVRGWIAALADPVKTLQVMMAANPAEDREFMRQALEVSMKLIDSPNATENGFGFMRSADWEGLQAALIEGKVIERKVAMTELFTNDYLPPNAKDWGKR